MANSLYRIFDAGGVPTPTTTLGSTAGYTEQHPVLTTEKRSTETTETGHGLAYNVKSHIPFTREYKEAHGQQGAVKSSKTTSTAATTGRKPVTAHSLKGYIPGTREYEKEHPLRHEPHPGGNW